MKKTISLSFSMNRSVIMFALLSTVVFNACNLVSDPDDPDGPSDSPITLECRYDESITLTNHNELGIDYIVPCVTEIFDGTFTIEPGTTILFEEGAGLDVQYDGILRIKGSASERVILSGDNPGNPSWRGINLASSKGQNIIEYADIVDAGDGQPFGIFTVSTAAISIEGRASIRECNIINSGGAGIYTYGNKDITMIDNISDLRIESCTSFPLYLSLNLAQNIDFESMEFVENGDNVVAFHNTHEDRLHIPLTLPELDIPYYIEGTYELYAGLTLEAGVDLQMGNNSALLLDNPENIFLNVQGTLSKRVTIRGKESVSGFWKGIYIGRNNVKNIFENLDISDGGATPLGFASGRANVTLAGTGSLKIVNCSSARSNSDCDIILVNAGGSPSIDVDSSSLDVCNE